MVLGEECHLGKILSIPYPHQMLRFDLSGIEQVLNNWICYQIVVKVIRLKSSGTSKLWWLLIFSYFKIIWGEFHYFHCWIQKVGEILVLQDLVVC